MDHEVVDRSRAETIRLESCTFEPGTFCLLYQALVASSGVKHLVLDNGEVLAERMEAIAECFSNRQLSSLHLVSRAETDA